MTFKWLGMKFYWLVNDELRHGRMLSPDSNQSFIEGHASTMAESFFYPARHQIASRSRDADYYDRQ